MAVHKAPTEGRMVADRFRRVWSIAQRIADVPGMTRSDLAARFNLSERQVQADLIIIRVEMGLPLVRSSGYRFRSADGATVAGAGGLDFSDLLQLVTVVRLARQQSYDLGADLAEKLARLAPLHLQPLAHELFSGLYRDTLWQVTVAALSSGDRSVNVLVRRRSGQMDTVKPELIVPYRGVWWIVGTDAQTGRSRMWQLSEVTSVEPVSIRVQRTRAAS